jgi:hypothetical protein
VNIPFNRIYIIKIGMSNSSQGQIINASVFVVSGYDELHAGSNCSKAEGKIVLFNTIFTTYGGTVSTRTNAAIWAQECKAVAALIRSIAPFSMQVINLIFMFVMIITKIQSTIIC